MSTNRKRWGWGLLAVAAAGFVALNALAYNHARAMTRFSTGGNRTGKPESLSLARKIRVLTRGVNLPRPCSTRLPAELDPACRVLEIPVPGGVTLSAWYVTKGARAPLVILFHGYGTEKTGLLPEAKILLSLGLSVLLVDFRGSGGSSESYTTLGVHEATDVIASVQYAREQLEQSGIILLGQSMGAVAILRAVHRGGVSPDAVILEAVFDSMLHTIRNRFDAMGVPSFPSAELLVFWGGRQWGFNGFAHNPVEYARSLRCPAFFTHGAADPRATMEEGRRVYEAAAGPKRFRVFPDTGHESYAEKHPSEWRDAVAEFLKELPPFSGTASAKGRGVVNGQP